MYKKMGLTRLQFNILMAILAGKGGNTVGWSVTGKAIAGYMGGRWSDERHEAALELQRRGMVVIHPLAVVGKRVRFYGLADGTRDWIEGWQNELVGGESVSISNMFTPRNSEVLSL
jgi:hypothetical protein